MKISQQDLDKARQDYYNRGGQTTFITAETLRNRDIDFDSDVLVEVTPDTCEFLS